MNKICKECLVEKPLSEFYAHPQGVMGTLTRCKECIKAGRKTERERIMSRKNDIKRNKSKDRIIHQTQNTKEFRKNNPEKYSAHLKVNNFLKYNPGYRVKCCIECGASGIIHYHHFDYAYQNKVIPCCPLCHKKFHNGLEFSESSITIFPF